MSVDPAQRSVRQRQVTLVVMSIEIVVACVALSDEFRCNLYLNIVSAIISTSREMKMTCASRGWASSVLRVG